MVFYHRRLLLGADTDSGDKSEGGRHSIPIVLVLSLGIVGAAFLFLSYFAMRRYASRRRVSLYPPNFVYSNNREDFTSELRPEIDNPVWHIRTVGLPQSVIESIQTFTYKKAQVTSDCSVCLSEFEDGESLRILPRCTHAFHVACIDMWLASHTNCPLCRTPILVADVNIPSTSQVHSRAMMTRDEGMEPEAVRRSVSLDLSSAVEQGEIKPSRSMSFTQSIPV